MTSLDDRAAELRDQMVDQLPSRGITDARVLDAMRAVPRHWFVERFVATPIGTSAWSVDGMREWTVDEACDDETLALVHDGERALPAPGSTTFDILTSVSAPNLVAEMLQLLTLETGMRVLEIGAGSGYNAALIAHLVDDPSLVTSVDIDDALIEPARRRLARVGCDTVVVLARDGDQGVPERAPFDRIVATVGCNDLSPAWFDQLSDDGFILCPTRHGTVHPIVRASRDGRSTIVAPSGFLKIRGRQDQDIWWPPRAGWIPDQMAWKPSPWQELEGRPMWDAALYVALRDRRASGPMPMLGHDGSAALVERDHGLGWCGDVGDALAARLESLLDDWDAIGRPAMTDYDLEWVAKSSEQEDAESLRGPWRIPRVHHDEVAALRS